MTDLMNVLVCGGRDYTDEKRLFDLLDFNRGKIRMIVHGAAKGADTLAGKWAATRLVPCLRVPAEWEKFGKRAGAVRNRLMLALVEVDLVVAFPGGAGTKMMMELARKDGVRVIDVADIDRHEKVAAEIDDAVERQRDELNHCNEEDPRVRNDRLNAEADAALGASECDKREILH